MIPSLNENGYLPRGIHKAALSEIRQRFGTHSLKRKKLFEGIISLIHLLSKHKGGIKRFLLNGSYTTSAESPEDYDCILILKRDFDFNSPDVEQLRTAKKLFGAHLFTFIEDDVVMYRRLIDFFGHDRDQRQKGLVEVIL